MKKLYNILLILAFTIYLLPLASFAQTQTELWGMTSRGGQFDAGVIFKTDGSGNNFNVQYSFNPSSDGGYPQGSLLYATDGKLYGMTQYGGANNKGTIFKYDPVTLTYTNIFDFDSINGLYPIGSLMQASDGKLYGMAGGGPKGWGTIFQYDLTSNTFQNLFDFTDAINEGVNPCGALIQASDGMLYGMTTRGGIHGNNSGYSGFGVIFQFDPSSLSYSKKIDLDANGTNPYGSLMQASDGMLYGMTEMGGTGGVIFQYDPNTNIYSIKINHTGLTGDNPYGSLIQASDGKLYGLTSQGGGVQGGSIRVGSIFQYNFVNSTINNRFGFYGGGYGNHPEGSLIQASNGRLYGLTTGYSPSIDVLFEYQNGNNNSSPIYTVKHSFGGGSNDGINPVYTNLIEIPAIVAPASVITTSSLSNSICLGSSLNISFISNGSFNAGNILTAQLSDASGSFAAPVDIGTLSSTSAGIINALIPGSTTPGNSFRIRVVSSNPSIIGNDNGKDITINDLPTVTAIATDLTFCAGGSTTLSGGGALSYVWSGGVSNGISFVPTSSNNYTVTGTDLNGCTNTANISITVITLPSPPVSGGDQAAIINTVAILSATSIGNFVDWYSTITGGTPLLSGSNTYTTSSDGTYYAESRNTTTGCVSSRTPIILSIADNMWDGSSWSGGSAPGSSESVLITGAYNGPDLSVANLTISNGGSLSLGSANTITVSGKLTIDNNATIDGTISAGSVSISPSGTFTLNPGSSLTTGNITIGGTVAIGGNISAGTVNITTSGTLTLNSGATLTSSGNITISSNAAGDGSLINNGTITGSAVVERYLPGASWHLISTSVAASNSGLYSGLYMRQYDESTDAFGAYITSTTMPLIPGTGAVLWANSATTISYNGSLNDGDIGPLTCTHKKNGYNLLGNPYPSAIDWNAASGWTKTNLSNNLWSWSETAGQYATYNGITGTNGGSQYIAMGQGFFVQALAGGGSLSMTKSVQVHNTISLMKSAKSEPPLIRLKVTGNKYSDEVVIMKDSMATSGIDYIYNAQKIKGYVSAPQLYTLQNDKMFSIYTYDNIDTTVHIPIYLSVGKDTSYKLTLYNNLEFKELRMYLFDKLNNTTQEIKDSLLYTFEAAPTDDSARFKIVFKADAALGIYTTGISKLNVWTAQQQLYITTSQNELIETVTLYDLNGRKLETWGRNSSWPVLLNLKQSVYIVNVTTNKQTMNYKIVIK